MWSEIFRALPMKQNLKKVYIFSTSRYSHMRWLCAELKQSGSEEKVYLNYFAGYSMDTELLQCKAILRADLSELPTDDRLLAAVRQLPKCQHLRAFGMRIDSDHMRLSLALAEFLRSATALHTLDLRIRGGGSQQAQGQNPWWNVILDSISRSKSVEKLSLVMSGMSIQDSQNLADSVKKNTYIRELRFENTPQANNTAFFRRLSRGIEDNYTLSTVECWDGLDADGVSDWLAVKETVWRNAGLVPRAARIKQASQSDRYVTGAVERVARYPALLDAVARSAKLDRAELAVLVRDRLLATKSKNGFMRFVGVVKERVICHPTDDGRMQLDDLDEDCWSHVRRYLFTDDVKIDVVQGDSA
ncbi:hypothetical protein HPB52_014395 [Rhipicephalus sanguineus]|uniref:Uncharacterized protein n=1 Tax=Rhipicephalus sanguineus TaxID=34632 RepID=A0A9D4T7M2_RHISA|nr:hypothetical protein HPB52_014395 [Rhipicephalus sanguineus]